MSHTTGKERLHNLLWRAVKKLPQDWAPYGEANRDDPTDLNLGADCSCGCLHYLVLADVEGEPLSNDWGVCANPKSHRCGLLTFEHQGCSAFEYDQEAGVRSEAEYERHRDEYVKKRGQ